MQLTYWNHNTAYHRWILKQISPGARVLDVGCGDGLLLEALSHTVSSAVGIEPDETAAIHARMRLQEHRHITVHTAAFEDYTPGMSFDAVIFAASLHHMDTEAALRHAAALLSPGGLLLIVGCARPKGLSDLCIETLRVIPAKIGSLLHGEKNGGDIGVPIKEPTLSYKEIKAAVSKLLPGAVMRRGLYYRYLLSWKKEIPSSGA